MPVVKVYEHIKDETAARVKGPLVPRGITRMYSSDPRFDGLVTYHGEIHDTFVIVALGPNHRPRIVYPYNLDDLPENWLPNFSIQDNVLNISDNGEITTIDLSFGDRAASTLEKLEPVSAI